MHQFIGCEHIKLVGIFFLVLVDLLTAGVDIYGEQCFGLIDDEIATMLETDRSAESRLHLTGDVEMVKNRLRLFVQLYNFCALGCDEFQVMAYLLIYLGVIDLNGGEIGTEYIAYDTERTPHLFAHETDGFALLECIHGLFPTLNQ